MLSWKGLFLKGFNLSSSGRGSYYFSNPGFQSCKVMPGSPMYYDNLGSRWKRILSEIFTVRFQSNLGIVLEVRLHDYVLYPRYVIYTVLPK